ncbi:RBBP9/YdeN family alpha/beta hydrolase [Arenibaculum pallidiluteum]|uniref:RBBP9/YdeN family alpha/beta hydrolase n=1 Tax=Arenibaculum pallidiluteum TaxID=2812559 RepID=UPI001A957907|nr:alpha/beta hydrolase [Arenibaculum pallidiluteum]
MVASVLILPGLGGSGPEHWQSLWEARNPAFRRVEQADWDAPERDSWVARLEQAVVQAEAPVVLVAHSLACALVGHWARAGSAAKVSGALLVAPADVDQGEEDLPIPIPPETRSFAPMPMERLPFASILVCSTDDPYCTPGRARAFAAAWGSRPVLVDGLGHINAASGLDAWPEGERLLDELVRGAA